ncbi:MAG: hypothetical protein ACRDNS_22185, partial [Trebonia sp.]
EPECAVELAEFRVLGEDWWTLAFEATGPVDVLRGHLSAAAALVFGEALPEAMELDVNDSMSYAQWLLSGRTRVGGDLTRPAEPLSSPVVARGAHVRRGV